MSRHRAGGSAAPAMRHAAETRRGGWASPIWMIVTAMVVSVSLGVGWAFWTISSVPGGSGASAAQSVGGGLTPTAQAAGSSVTVSWPASSLSGGQAVSGYTIKRVDASTLAEQIVLNGCSGTIAVLSCVESSVPNGQWKYSVTPRFATNWLGSESARSATVTVETTPPANALSISVSSGAAYLSGSTVFFRGASPGAFTVTNAVTDAGSGPASSTSALLSGAPTWAHTGSTVSAPTGGPYVSNSFSWSSTTAGSASIIGRDASGNTATTNLTFTDDSTGPALGTISYTDGFEAQRSATVTFTAGVDAGSGVATAVLQRAAATLSNNSTCGTYSSFVTVSGANPTSPFVDSTVVGGKCYQYRYAATDRLGNVSYTTSSRVSKVDYAGAVAATTGVLSHWRLGESAATPISVDSLSGTAGALLTSRAGETGATWTQIAGNPASTAVFTTNASVNTVRHAAGGIALYYTSGVPSTANYRVEADVVVKSLLAGEAVGVVGRLNTAGTGDGTFYTARYNMATSQWQIVAYVNGSQTVVGTSYGETLALGRAYRLGLDMNGTTMSLLVDGVVRVTGTNSSIAAAGRGGVRIANANSAAGSDTTGLHLRHFQMTLSTYPRAVDSKGSNTADYKGGPALAATGAVATDSNTAATFDGTNDYVQAVGTTGIPVGSSARSVEMWFKTTATSQQTLFAYGTRANAQEFGLWLNPGGTAMTAWGWGTGNDFVFTLPSAANNGAWHQVVQTYNGTTLSLYYDGGLVSSVAATRSTVMDASGIGIGGAIPIGDGNSGFYFTGSLDEVSFYTTALSAPAIAGHYALATSPTSTYASTIAATAGLLNNYRLAETTTVKDSFAGTAGAVLSTRAGETGASWTSLPGGTANAALTNEGRIRKAGASSYGAIYGASGVPASPNYTVSADIHVKSSITYDIVGIAGRVDAASVNGTYYVARYEQQPALYTLNRVVNGTWTYLGGYAATLSPGSTSRLALDLNGSSLRVFVDGVERITAVDSGITSTGTTAALLGFGWSGSQVLTTVTDTTGMHLDNFSVTPLAVDSKSANNGTIFGATLGAAGAISDSTTAMSFDGVDDFVSVPRQIADDFTVEFLFKSTQGLGSGAQWWTGAGLVDADMSGSGYDFGVSLSSAGRIIAGQGYPDASFTSASAGFNDGAWHHVVLTRTKTTGVMTLYVDGELQGTQTSNTNSLNWITHISFGRINSNGGYFAGSIDEVALYNVALSSTQVAAHNAAR